MLRVVKALQGTPCFEPETFGAQCSRCPLKRFKKPVRGQGPAVPFISLVGEAPGKNEVEAGVPFIGKAGELLEAFLGHVRLNRPQVYIDNALCCMPPGGNLEDFLKGHKRGCKDDGLEYVSPVDCCRPRLFRELGVPRCSVCNSWRLGSVDIRCSCKNPRWAVWSHRELPKVVMPMGNAAMLSLLGYGGISKWRGSPIAVR